MLIGNHGFKTKNETYIMGILNVTPDSFSDGGTHNTLDQALFHTEKMIAEGASIVDVGGESTRPGYTVISDEEEIARVCPVIEEIKKRFDIPVSVDTYKGDVADAAIRSGADLINDIWGLKHDDKIAGVIAENGIPACLMHNRENTNYRDFVTDVRNDLMESLVIAEKAGIRKEHIILDPGVGFAKSYEQNLTAIREMKSCIPEGYPILLGTSRKSVIGLTLNLPSSERVEGTMATTVMAVMNGCMFVRVHDVKENMRAIKMTQAILNSAE